MALYRVKPTKPDETVARTVALMRSLRSRHPYKDETHA